MIIVYWAPNSPQDVPPFPILHSFYAEPIIIHHLGVISSIKIVSHSSKKFIAIDEEESLSLSTYLPVTLFFQCSINWNVNYDLSSVPSKLRSSSIYFWWSPRGTILVEEMYGYHSWDGSSWRQFIRVSPLIGSMPMNKLKNAPCHIYYISRSCRQEQWGHLLYFFMTTRLHTTPSFMCNGPVLLFI